MGNRIRIERHVATHQRQPVGKTEIAEPRPGILTRGLLAANSIAHTEETAKKRVQRNRNVTLSAPDDRPLKSKLEVFRRTERKHLGMNTPRSRNVMPLQTPNIEVIPHRPTHLRHERDVQRLHPIDAERIDILPAILPSHL